MSRPKDEKAKPVVTKKDQTKPPGPVKGGSFGIGDPPPVKVGYSGEIGKKK